MVGLEESPHGSQGYLPSSGPAEATSESTAWSSPVSELLSRSAVGAPSVQHPLELDLEKGLGESSYST